MKIWVLHSLCQLCYDDYTDHYGWSFLNIEYKNSVIQGQKNSKTRKSYAKAKKFVNLKNSNLRTQQFSKDGFSHRRDLNLQYFTCDS